MPATLLRIHPENPPHSRIQQAVEVLRKGGVIIYPTDTVYGIGCDVTNAKAVEKVCRIKKLFPEKANLSFICSDLSHISDYAHGITTETYKVIKKALPGPFTFIFEASSNAPRFGGTKRKTVGIWLSGTRMPTVLRFTPPKRGALALASKMKVNGPGRAFLITL